MKILIVDDSKAMRMIIKRTLNEAGYGGHSIVEAENGKQGLKALHDESFDVVLCDWNMPEMSGIEMLIALKAEKLPVHFGFVTSESTPAKREEASDAGAEFLIGKPFTKEIFQEVLGALFAA
jgi:two-component system chemotaxis response regulator CheY